MVITKEKVLAASKKLGLKITDHCFIWKDSACPASLVYMAETDKEFNSRDMYLWFKEQGFDAFAFWRGFDGGNKPWSNAEEKEFNLGKELRDQLIHSETST